MTVAERAARIRMVLLDVDGVMTDGKILVHADGTESKRFDIKDGSAIVLARRAGLVTGVLSARDSAATVRRASQLGMDVVRQGVADKLAAFEAILEELGLGATDVAYMGDDVVDLPVLGRTGLAGAPADAVPEVRAAAHWVSARPGGDGAVREFVELILKTQARWESLLDGRATGAGPVA